MKPFLVRLRILLLCNILYYSILFLSIVYLFIFIKYDKRILKYNLKTYSVELFIKGYNIDVDKLSIEFIGDINLIGTHYFENEEEVESFKNKYKLNDKVLVTGELSIPKNNTIPNTFNYKKYLLYKDIDYIMNIDNIELLSSNTNVFYKLKNKVINIIDNINNNEYLYAFILGNSKYLSYEVSNNYRINTITHLFALSGLHVSILAMIVSKLFSKMNEKMSLLLISLVLFLLCFITSFSPSILRATILFIMLNLNKIYYTHIKPRYLLYVTFSIMIFINPYYIYHLGFILSFTVTFFLILSNEYIKIKNKLFSILIMSIISFSCSIPIIINNFYKINILGFINNLFFIPYVSYIVYPFSLLVFVFNFLSPILNVLTSVMEYISSISTHVFNLNIYFSKMSTISIIVYYILLVLTIKYKKKLFVLLIVSLLLFSNIKTSFNKDTCIYFIDVGQGDSILIKSKNNRYILIDTGGKENFFKSVKRNREFNLMEDSMIPFFRSIGVNKIDYLFLTHGDADHSGNAYELISNIKVNNKYINNGNINYLEERISHNILLDSYMKIDNIDIYSLNNTIYDNENDNSIVLLLKIYNYQVLLMADASIKTEKDILEKHNLGKIDILKLGHHGSNTSTCKQLLEITNPTYSIISVSLKNKYNHPSIETINNLKEYNLTYYETSKYGTIKFCFNDKSMKHFYYLP